MGDSKNTLGFGCPGATVLLGKTGLGLLPLSPLKRGSAARGFLHAYPNPQRAFTGALGLALRT